MIKRAIGFCFGALLLLTPWVMFAQTSEIFELNKIVFIYIVTTVVVALKLIQSIGRQEPPSVRPTRLDWFILVFVASQIISTIFSIDRHTSLFGYYGRFNGGLFSVISYALLYWVLMTSFYQASGRALVLRLMKISLVSSLIVILWGLPGKLGHDLSCLVFTGQFNNGCWTDQFNPAVRVFSTLGQPNWLGAYLAINLFFGLYFLVKNSRKTFWFITNGFYLLLNFSFILFTRSRSALAAAVIGIVAWLIWLVTRRQGSVNRRAVAALALFLLPVLLFRTGSATIDRWLSGQVPSFQNAVPAARVSPSANQTGTPGSLYDLNDLVTDSFAIRRIVWQGAWELGKRYPFFGTGVETFASAYYFVRPAAHNLTSEWDYIYNKAHNEYLNYLATTGFVGLLAYGAMIGAVIAITVSRLRQARGDPDRARLLFSLLLAYGTILITNFFGFSTTTINLYFYLLPAFILIVSRPPEKQTKEKITELDRKPVGWRSRLEIGAIAVATFWVISSCLLFWYADIQYSRGEMASQINQYQIAASLFDRALRFHYEPVYQDKLSYALANLAYLMAYQKQTATANQLIKLADWYNRQTMAAAPKNVLYLKTRAKNYYLFYQIDLNKKDLEEAVRALEQAVKLSPTDPKLHYSLAIFYSLLSDEDKTQATTDRDKSLSEAQATIRLKANYRDGYLLYGQLLAKYKQTAAAKTVLEKALHLFGANDPEIKKTLEQL
ncbi:O-antigen ligase family protein [Patescibacteria group bacterium]|nr:O-antigen ligase family protein [Patescibacteria group bacterium]MCL5091850.1 O-antigen ligase family protein [Patescibacteria group bacterium]